MADQGPGQQRPAGWKKDPSGRHFGWWWDGSTWTEHVISAEKVALTSYRCDPSRRFSPKLLRRRRHPPGRRRSSPSALRCNGVDRRPPLPAGRPMRDASVDLRPPSLPRMTREGKAPTRSWPRCAAGRGGRSGPPAPLSRGPHRSGG